MTFKDTTLPWTGASVRGSDNLHSYFGTRLPPSWSRYLPASITLYVDPAVQDTSVLEFLSSMAEELRRELERRKIRQEKFVRLGLLSEEELEKFLTLRTGAQAWALYFSEVGGLGPFQEDYNVAKDARGVIPCSTMQNHGVAWARDDAGNVRTWLATSRRKGSGWDWESDIGHESAHAAFAQVPFFVQSSPQIPNDVLTHGSMQMDITPTQIAQIMYLYSEIAVVAMRGEPRATETGLPVALHSELEALLRVSAILSGDPTLEDAARISASVRGKFDVNDGEELFRVAGPIMRHIPYLTKFINDPIPPTQLQFEAAMKRW
jgi:hypothetical protein